MTKVSVEELAELTPSKIVAELNKYIIGQEEAKKAVAIALRNRWRRMQVPEQMRKEIMPNNILMIGATGVGKTEIARRLAQITRSPFIKVEASKFTEVGYVGRDVESMVRDLAEQAVNLVKAEFIERVKTNAKQQAEEILLDLLVPPVTLSSPAESNAAQSSEPNATPSDHELNQNTRNHFREKLKSGELDEKFVEMEVTLPNPSVQVVGPGGMEAMEGLQEMLSGMMPAKKKKRRLPVKEAREILISEEAQRLIDMEAVTREAIFRAENQGIIFIDEIDKVAVGGSRQGGPDVSREGVQRDLLPIVEGSAVNTKYGTLKTDYVLFIAAGAFHVAKPSDLIPELQGRFPIRVELNALTEDDFYQILTQPQNALTLQYKSLMKTEGVELQFDSDALKEIAKIAFSVNAEIENIGARRLHTLFSAILQDWLFKIPDQSEETAFHVTSDFVTQQLKPIFQKKDLSRYIL